MPEATFNALTDHIKEAGHACRFERPVGQRQDHAKVNDPIDDGRRIAEISAAAFREAIKVKD